MPASPAEEGVVAVVIATVLALFASLITYATVCAEQHACLKAGTCYALSNSSFSCGFKNAITPAGWRLLNVTAREASLQAMSDVLVSTDELDEAYDGHGLWEKCKLLHLDPATSGI